MQPNELKASAEALKDTAVAIRRDLHRHPETSFCEYRTAAFVAETLMCLGFSVRYGREVSDLSETVLPSSEKMDAAADRAVRDGADAELVTAMRGGYTGVIGTIDGTAGGGGQTVAFRFDMDANALLESDEAEHRPTREGFASVYTGAMHACGHDGHVAIGLTLAHLLARYRDAFSGRVKLIFQPAEEGVLGALPMLRAGAVDDVDVMLGGHIGLSANRSGTLIASVGEFFAAGKFDASFRGRSSHAGLAPEKGSNALLAAANAALALHALPRHGSGASRINVGVLHSGTARNVIPDYAEMQFETRGMTTEINDFMEAEARRITEASAAMYGVTLSLRRVAHAEAFTPDPAFGAEIAKIARWLGYFDEVADYGAMNASEDCTSFLSRVREKGGKAIYMMFGADLAAGHHNARFDFDEGVLPRTAAFLLALALYYGGEKK